MKLSSPNFNFVSALILSSSLVLTACGGGGDSGGSSPAAVPPPPANVSPIMNAGADQTVNEDQVVSIRPTFSDADGTIVTRTYSQIAGPTVVQTVVSLNQMHFDFVAPETGASASVALTFSFTVTDNSGGTAVDTIVVTVNRVNDVPVASAGADVSFRGLSEVALTGTGTDVDGSIASYEWKQVSGPTVAIRNAATASAAFTAPTTIATQLLVFSLTVTDNSGAAVSDTVTITVTSENTPELAMTFPTARATLVSSQLSAFGTLKTKGGATVGSVRVSTSAGGVNATVDSNGRWAAQGIPVPGETAFQMTVTLVDSNALTASAVSDISKSTDQLQGSGAALTFINGLNIDSIGNKAYVVGSNANSTVIASIDLATGARANISFTYPAAVSPAFTGPLEYEATCNCIYAIVAPSDITKKQAVLKLLLTTSIAEVAFDVGRGPMLKENFPFGLALLSADKFAWSDVEYDTITQYNLTSSTSTPLVTSSTALVGALSPPLLSYSKSLNTLYFLQGYNDALEIVKLKLDAIPLQTEEVVSHIFTPSPGTPVGMAIHPVTGGLFGLIRDGRLGKVDSTLHTASFSSPFTAGVFSESSTSEVTSALAFHSGSNILYAITRSGWLYATDVDTQSTIIVSRD